MLCCSYCSSKVIFGSDHAVICKKGKKKEEEVHVVDELGRLFSVICLKVDSYISAILY